MGNLGHALARSQGFSTQNFRTVALLDVDPAKIGEVVAGQRIRHLSELAVIAATANPAIGVIASPASAAQDVCDRLVAAGVGAILNFAPAILTVPQSVLLRQVDFSVELQVLAFFVAHPEAATGAEDASDSPL